VCGEVPAVRQPILTRIFFTPDHTPEEIDMASLPQVFGEGMNDSSIARNYHELLEQSAAARSRGDHWTAQKLATRAHQCAMDDHARIQRLSNAYKMLDAANRRVETARARDPECTTDEEFLNLHPEFKALFSAREKALQSVYDLENPEPPAQKPSK
jgi:hypothetical protein